MAESHHVILCNTEAALTPRDLLTILRERALANADIDELADIPELAVTFAIQNNSANNLMIRSRATGGSPGTIVLAPGQTRTYGQGGLRRALREYCVNVTTDGDRFDVELELE